MFPKWFHDLFLTISLHYPFFVSFLLLFPIFCLLKLISRKPKLKLPPSPPKLPIIGNLHQLAVLRLLHFPSLQTLSNKYGPVMLFHLGTTPILLVSSAEMAQEMMKNDIAFSNRINGRASKVLLYSSITRSGFENYGEYWRQVRRISADQLLSQKRVQMSSFVRQEEVAKMIEKIQLSSLNGASVHLNEMLLNLSSNIISRSCFGKVYGNDENAWDLQLLRRALALLEAFCFEDLIPSLRWMDVFTGFTGKVKRLSAELDCFLNLVIEERRQLLKAEGEMSDDKMCFLDFLLLDQEDGSHLGIELNRDRVKEMLMVILLGGTSSPAVLMEWAMAEMIKHPNIMRKTQEEVRRVVGGKKEVTEAQLDQMEYLKCIIKETLRLHGGGVIIRETHIGTTLGGYEIQPRTKVLVNVHAIHRDDKHWDRPGEFLPERFTNNKFDSKGVYCYIPFGFGRRSCPGMSFSAAQVEYVLANLLYWFDWKLPNGANAEELDMTEHSGLSTHKKIPLHVVPVSPF